MLAIQWLRPVWQIGLALLFAIWLSGAVRSTTVELNQTLGVVWPFSLAHCQVEATPGCSHPARIASAEPSGKLGLFKR